MSFFIKSDILCPWSIDLKTLVRNRFDVLIDFTIESIKGGVREVYVMLCDGTTYHVTSIPSDRSREVASWLRPSFKSTLDHLVKRYGRVYYLHERGRDISDVKLEDGLYVFGDHDGLSPHDEEILSRRAIWVSLGPTPYMSWQAAAYVAHLLKKLNIT